MKNRANSFSAIIVRLPNWVGDVCMSLPSLQVVQQALQSTAIATDKQLIVCGRPWAEDLVSQFKPSQFVALTGKFMADRRAVLEIPKSTRQTSRGLIMPDSFSSAALFAISSIGSAGYRDDGRSWLLRWPISKPNHPVHAAQKWWLLTQHAFRAWNLDIPALSAKLPPYTGLELRKIDHQQADEALSVKKLDTKPFILVAPTATGMHKGQIKVWPHFNELVKSLKHQHPAIEIIMCPPAHEQAQAANACPEATLLAPLPLKAFCALAQRALLVVCNDSGVSHLGAAVNARQITLFGVTDPAHTGPWSEKVHMLGQQGKWPNLQAVTAKINEMLTHPELSKVKSL